MNPTVTVVTITFNSELHLEQTINSVGNQSYNHIEYIVIDGASTDATLSIIEKYSAKIDYFISEPDAGIADAMNKGIKYSTGEYLLFLHSDDYFYTNDSLERCMAGIGNDSQIYACDVLYGANLTRKSSKEFGFWTNFKTRMMHQGVICNRAVFDNVGIFDTEFLLAMDFDFFMRAYKQGYQITKAPHVLSVMRDTGIGSRQDWNSLKERFAEEKKVQYKNNGTAFFQLLYSIYWPLYLSYRWIVHLISDNK